MAAKKAKDLLHNEEEAKKFINSCDSFIFDLDGCVWLQSDLIPGVAELMDCFKQLGKKVFFVTNSNDNKRDHYLKRFESHGIHVKKSEVYTSAFGVAYYLKHIMKFDKKIYMLGAKGLSEELDEVGIPNIGCGRDEATNPEDGYNENFDLDPEVGGVVSGFDPYISVRKFTKATSYLARDESCLFVATNPDERFPIPSYKNFVAPGSGCFAAFLEKAARRSPVYAGKPSHILFDCIVDEHKIDPARTCMMGDTLNTDIIFGNKCGTKTVLVFTGNTSPEMLKRAMTSTDANKKQSIPDFVLPSVGHLLPIAKQLLINQSQ